MTRCCTRWLHVTDLRASGAQSKPSCPFCGACGHIYQNPMTSLFFVGCKGCGARTDDFKTEMQAWTFWGTRVEKVPPATLEEPLKDESLVGWQGDILG